MAFILIERLGIGSVSHLRQSDHWIIQGRPSETQLYPVFILQASSTTWKVYDMIITDILPDC